MARPASKPDWMKNNPNFAQRAVEPTAQKKTMGWNIGERPASEIFNWILWNFSEWLDHFDESNTSAITIRETFDAILGGANSTHADINAIMADGSLAASDLRVLIAGPLVFAQTQIVNKDGVEFYGTPGGTISRGGATAVGIQITSSRIKIRDTRFLNWDQSGGKAIEIKNTSKNCLIVENYFHNVETDIDDEGKNNIIVNNVLEID